MANSPQAKKRARQSEVSRQQNAALRSKLRTAIRNVTRVIDAGDKELGKSAYYNATRIIDASVTKGIIHKNKAARHKSQLNTRLHQMQ